MIPNTVHWRVFKTSWLISRSIGPYPVWSISEVNKPLGTSYSKYQMGHMHFYIGDKGNPISHGVPLRYWPGEWWIQIFSCLLVLFMKWLMCINNRNQWFYLANHKQKTIQRCPVLMLFQKERVYSYEWDKAEKKPPVTLSKDDAPKSWQGVVT